eukprot:15476505-Alexandrium_andersonii.AAC.1
MAKFGRRAEVALASALWCSESHKTSENRQAAREAVTTDWPRAMGAWDRRESIKNYVNSIGWGSEYSHSEPAGSEENARSMIAIFKSKFARDGFLTSVRTHGFAAWGIQVMARPQVPRYLRESQQLLRCAMRAYSNTLGARVQLRPEWDLQAVALNGAW